MAMNTRFVKTSLSLLCIMAFFLSVPILCAQTTCLVNLNTTQITNPQASKLLGISMDGRSSMDFNAGAGVNALGYYDPSTGAALPSVQSLWDRVPIGGVRYPGNLVVLNWNWSYTVGPFANRTAQPMSPGGANSQALQFGFDEFMDMAASKGIAPGDVQIMVNIYPSVGQPNPATLAADWVEYCNAPDNGINLRGGMDWAKMRVMNGHPEPYNIKIWNIGNEPWTGSEFGSSTTGAHNYMAVASPIIDSMKSVDPNIQITIPAVGPPNSLWNTEIMNPLAPTPLLGKIYGLSSHAFYDEDASTMNPAPTQVLAVLSNLAGVAAGKNLKIVAGDHASFAPSADPDKAMRWEGALATGDYLLGISQISNIELANFWIYGNTMAVWHPIRKNANGTYTLMAAAQLYEALFPYFYDQAFSCSIVNSTGGGAVPNTRVAAFQNEDQTKTSVIVINTSLVNNNEIIPPALSGFSIQTAKLLTASSINEDTFITSNVLPLGNGHYQSPKISILILDYAATALAVEFTEPIRAFKVKEGIAVEWATASETNCDRFEVERSSDGVYFEKKAALEGSGNSSAYRMYRTIDDHPINGMNYYRIKQIDFDGMYSYSKIVAARYDYFEVTIFPNPVGDLIYFQSSEPIARIDLLNELGNTILTWTNPHSAIDLSRIPNGIYTLKILDKNHLEMFKKITKIR